ncbi:MAG: hypothetical protein ABH884_03290 [Candidatus Komeilibacteria bacterium]
MQLFESGGDPEGAYNQVINKIVSSIQDKILKQSIGGLLNMSSMRTNLMRIKPTKLFNLTDDVIQETIISTVNDCYPDGWPNPLGSLLPLKTNYKMLLKAFQIPETFEREKEVLIDQMRVGKTGTGALEELNKMNAALEIVTTYQKQINNLTRLLKFALTITNQGQPLLLSFLKELAILQRLNYNFSQHIQTRFVKRFSQGIRNTAKQTQQTMILNTLGELVLVSMGIISPKLFSTKCFQQDPDYFLAMRSDLNDIHVDIDWLLHHYQLNSRGTIFFCRWHTLNQPATRITDQLIRNFITQTIRAKQDEILTTMNFDKFVTDAKEICQQCNNRELMNKLSELFIDHISTEDFQNMLVDNIKKWHTELCSL